VLPIPSVLTPLHPHTVAPAAVSVAAGPAGTVYVTGEIRGATSSFDYATVAQKG